MMPFILLLIGLVLLFLEFYTPGGILAVAGIIFLLAAITTYLLASSSALGSVAFLVLTIVALSFVIWFALRRIKKSGPENTFYLSKDQEGYVSTRFDTTAIGKTGTALTDFGPSGFVLIDGKRHSAVCRGPYLDKGQRVTVIGGEGADLIVKPIL